MLSEMRIVASLILQGESPDEIIDHVVRDNLFQYPTERSLKDKARCCLARFQTLREGRARDAAAAGAARATASASCDATAVGDPASDETYEAAVRLIAAGTSTQAAQMNLYILMKRYALVNALMMDEIGAHMSQMNMSFTKADMGAFLTRFQLEYPGAAKWSDATINRLKSALTKILVQTGFLAATNSDELQVVFVDEEVDQAIRANGDAALLFAFDGTTIM